MKDPLPDATKENASIVGSSLTGSKHDIENCTGPGYAHAYIISFSFVFAANLMTQWLQLYLFFLILHKSLLYANVCNHIHFS